MHLARLHRHRAAAQIILVVTASALLSLMSGACVPTDEPRQNNSPDGFVPFVPDQGQDMPKQDMPDGLDMSTDQDQGRVEQDMPDSGMPADMMINPNVCLPNKDAKITRQEVPLRVGLNAKYRVGLDAPVSTAGEDAGGGKRRWDLSGELNGDRLALVEAQNPLGRWFSADFPTATYITRLSETSELLGIFELTDDALLLIGVASPTDGFTRTKLTYDPPITVLDFPLEPEKRWTTESSVSGIAQGVAVFYSEDYSSQVDAQGELVTPYGTFEQVLRVRVELERVIGFSTTRKRTFSFVTECFGTIATIVSEDNETAAEFTTAAEVRRLSP